MFCLTDSRVAEVLRIMHFLPNAVIQGGDFGISDLVSEKARLGIRRLRPSHRRHWLVLAWHGRGRRLPAFVPRDQSQTSVQSKPGPGATAADEITSRRDVVGILAPLKFPALQSPQPARVRIDVMLNI